jgi:hypothetical protein
MQTTEELTVFFEQFDCLPSTPHLPIEVKLTLFSKLHYINNNEIDKIILIIDTLFEQKSCAIPFFLKAGQASEIKNTIYLIILFCYDSFHSGTESLVTSAGRGAKVRHID